MAGAGENAQACLGLDNLGPTSGVGPVRRLARLAHPTRTGGQWKGIAPHPDDTFTDPEPPWAPSSSVARLSACQSPPTPSAKRGAYAPAKPTLPRYAQSACRPGTLRRRQRAAWGTKGPKRPSMRPVSVPDPSEPPSQRGAPLLRAPAANRRTGRVDLPQARTIQPGAAATCLPLAVSRSLRPRRRRGSRQAGQRPQATRSSIPLTTG